MKAQVNCLAKLDNRDRSLSSHRSISNGTNSSRWAGWGRLWRSRRNARDDKWLRNVVGQGKVGWGVHDKKLIDSKVSGATVFISFLDLHFRGI